MKLMATCCPGLEFVLEKEIQDTLEVHAQAERGKAFFDAAPEAANALRCADNLHAWVGEVRIGPTRPDLPDFARSLERLPMQETLMEMQNMSAERIHVTASRAGRHSYSRFEAAAAALPALCKAAGGEPGDESRHTCAFRLDIVDDHCRVYIKLTPPEFRFRGARDFSPAALRPTIAHALVLLTEPTPKDVFLDPFCGSGTLLAERMSLPHAAVLGGDIDPTAVQAASVNARRYSVQQWDATALPLEDASISAVATNPPWGKQIAIADETRLYGGFIAELRRVCRKGARIVVLTDRKEALLTACASVGWNAEQLATLSLHGTLAGIFCIMA